MFFSCKKIKDQCFDQTYFHDMNSKSNFSTECFIRKKKHLHKMIIRLRMCFYLSILEFLIHFLHHENIECLSKKNYVSSMLLSPSSMMLKNFNIIFLKYIYFFCFPLFHNFHYNVINQISLLCFFLRIVPR